MNNTNAQTLHECLLNICKSFRDFSDAIDSMLAAAHPCEERRSSVKAGNEAVYDLFNQPKDRKAPEGGNYDHTLGGWSKHKPIYIRKSTAVKACGVSNKVFDEIYNARGYCSPFIPEGFTGKAHYILTSDFKEMHKLFTK